MKSHLFTTRLVSLFLTSLLGIMAANLPAIANESDNFSPA